MKTCEKYYAGLLGSDIRPTKNIEGAYDFGEFLLIIDPVQGDPFASYDNPESKDRGE